MIETIFVNALAAATGAAANVVTPVLTAPGSFRCRAATITLLLAQTSGVDPSLFPQLVAAFTRVAKAAALFTGPATGARRFRLPGTKRCVVSVAEPGESAALHAPQQSVPAIRTPGQALQLNRRQAARSPKLFDVLAGWRNALPADVQAPSGNGGALAVALNASVPDLTRLAITPARTHPAHCRHAARVRSPTWPCSPHRRPR